MYDASLNIYSYPGAGSMRRSAVAREIDGMEPGSVFCAADFEEITTPRNAANQLARLAADGTVQRLLRGIYWIPTEPEAGADAPAPALDDLAQAIGRSNHWIVAPSGANALAIFGLPGAKENCHGYATSGQSADYEFQGQAMSFRHSADRYLANLAPGSRTAVQAFRALGRDGATRAVAETMAERLSQRELDALSEDAPMLPPWMGEFITRLRAEKGRQAERFTGSVAQGAPTDGGSTSRRTIKGLLSTPPIDGSWAESMERLRESFGKMVMSLSSTMSQLTIPPVPTYVAKMPKFELPPIDFKALGLPPSTLKGLEWYPAVDTEAMRKALVAMPKLDQLGIDPEKSRRLYESTRVPGQPLIDSTTDDPTGKPNSEASTDECD